MKKLFIKLKYMIARTKGSLLRRKLFEDSNTFLKVVATNYRETEQSRLSNILKEFSIIMSCEVKK